MTEPHKLRMGMVGGGPGAFIGPVHRMAAELDGKIELVAGAFSQSPERSREAGMRFHLDPARAYADYRQMIEAESKRPDGVDFMAIVAPNHMHLPVALAALESGIPVMSDKPATANYDEALKLQAAVAKSGLLYGLTHTYAGYAMVRDARALCAAGKLGTIRKVAVEYMQGWLSGPLESTGQKQAVWRTDPARSGAGGAIGDIGTHAFHLMEYIRECFFKVYPLILSPSMDLGGSCRDGASVWRRSSQEGAWGVCGWSGDAGAAGSPFRCELRLGEEDPASGAFDGKPQRRAATAPQQPRGHASCARAGAAEAGHRSARAGRGHARERPAGQ